MQEVLQKYKNYLQAELNASPYTVRNYTRDLNDFLLYLKDRKIEVLGGVDKHVIRDYLGLLVKQKVYKSSIARKLSAIRSFYKYLMRENLIKENPVAGTSSPKLDKRLPSFLSIEQVTRLINAVDLSTPQGQRDRALIELLYGSGLRVSEIVGLNLGQVDLGNGEIRVLGKGSKERLTLMGKPAMDALTAYLSRGRPELLKNKRSNALFVSQYGIRLTERRVQKILVKYAAYAGLDKKVHPHLLRHTFATHLLDGGADLRVVQELLGHASLSSTQIYTHVTKSQARKVYLAAHPLARERDNGLEGTPSKTQE